MGICMILCIIAMAIAAIAGIVGAAITREALIFLMGLGYFVYFGFTLVMCGGIREASKILRRLDA